MTSFRVENNRLVREMNHEILWIESWGKDGFRVRSTINNEMPDIAWALLEPDSETGLKADLLPDIKISEHHASITNGLIKVIITNDGKIAFKKTSDDSILLEEVHSRLLTPPNRSYKAVGGNLFRTETRFRAYDDERFYGLGQHQHGFLDQKGCVIDLKQKNTEVVIPWLISNRMYGFLWNNPGIGRVELARNATTWISHGTRLIDYYVTTGNSYFDLMERYADVTGHPPMIPEWATGFWQCKLRYESPEQLMGVAREYKKRGLPLSVLVIDFLHWTRFGEWRFNTETWPDPELIVRELESMGITVMVSLWPTVGRNSENYWEMLEKGYLLRTDKGMNILHCMPDNPSLDQHYMHFYDSTNPGARKFLWDRVKRGYYDKGIKGFWLDACEPETYPADFENIRYHIGNGLEVGCIYPFEHQKGFWEGIKSAGGEEILTLCRSAWAGSQRFGAAVWSGDIESTFEVLQQQLKAGLNIAMSGIPWWTTDIGGFMGGNINSPYFQELIVRWFQYGIFCPLFRLHGNREPLGYHTGADNEVWSFGDKAYDKIVECLHLREKLRPYIMDQMKLAHLKGTPVIRPLFFDFPHDKICYEIEDQFMFGPEIMVAPILEEGVTAREIYLPEEASWEEDNSLSDCRIIYRRK